MNSRSAWDFHYFLFCRGEIELKDVPQLSTGACDSDEDDGAAHSITAQDVLH